MGVVNDMYWTIFGKLYIWNENVNPGSRSHANGAVFMVSLSHLGYLVGVLQIVVLLLDVRELNEEIIGYIVVGTATVVLALNYTLSRDIRKLINVVGALRNDRPFRKVIKNILVTMYVIGSFLVPLGLGYFVLHR